MNVPAIMYLPSVLIFWAGITPATRLKRRSVTGEDWSESGVRGLIHRRRPVRSRRGLTFSLRHQNVLVEM